MYSLTPKRRQETMDPMNPIARELNEQIAAENPYVVEMLSSLGKDLYFPKGILTQSAEAKKKAYRFDATIGTAMEDGIAMNLPCVMAPLKDISPNDALLYAPSYGKLELREAWVKKIEHDNPSLVGKAISLPVVTSGLTHGLSLIADMFLDAGDVVLMPDMIWGNYRLIFSVRRGARIVQYNFFKDGRFDIAAFREALQQICASTGKVLVLLNFPNNPSGYTPTEPEGQAIAEALVEAVETGANVIALTDDAYYGLFFEDDVMPESLFSKLAGVHPRLLAVKGDAATKEVYVWGLRVGFVTFSVGGASAAGGLYSALEKKAGGCIRGTISNCSNLSQKIVYDALVSDTFYAQRAAKVAVMKERAQKVKQVLRDPKFEDAWTPYPFNSGYFMCIRLKQVNAEALRVHVLDTYGIGTISINDTDLRIAFSCLEVEQVQELFDLLLQGCRDLSASS